MNVKDDDDDTIVRLDIEFECKSVDKEARTVDVVASSTTIDAHGDIVEQDWDLKRYKKNPVILWNHRRVANRSADELPIGRASKVRVEDGKLAMRIHFASEKANPLAEQVFLLYAEGIMRAVSVGFRPGKVTKEVLNGVEIYRMSANELRETSCVPIGSNPDAVAKQLEADREQLARRAVETAPGAKEKSMNEEEMRKAVEDAKVQSGIAERAYAAEKGLRELAEKALADEKALSAKAAEDLEKAREQLKLQGASLVKAMLDKHQGVKFVPAERDELEDLAKAVGLERVEKLIAARPDITLITPVQTPEGDPLLKADPLKTKANPSADIANEALKRAKGA